MVWATKRAATRLWNRLFRAQESVFLHDTHNYNNWENSLTTRLMNVI